MNSQLNHRYGDDLTFYSIAPRSPPSTPLPNMKKEKKSARPLPLIIDNSIDTYLTSEEEEEFIFSDNSVEEEAEGGAYLEKREKQYVLPVLHNRPKIRFSPSPNYIKRGLKTASPAFQCSGWMLSTQRLMRKPSTQFQLFSGRPLSISSCSILV